MNYRNKRKLGEPKEGYFGQFNTDVIIELYFNNIVLGNCVEVGVANGTRGSNTLYFEKKGWETLCIEPNPEYYEIAKSVLITTLVIIGMVITFMFYTKQWTL